MSRGESGRALAAVNQRSERGLRALFRETGALRLGLADTAKVHRAADVVREKAKRHHEKHRETWIARHYTRLLLKSAPTLALNPPGVAADPKVSLMRRARNEVAQDHAKRLHIIDKARTSLAQTGKLRGTRSIDWGDKSATPGNASKASALEQGSARSQPLALSALVEAGPAPSPNRSVTRNFNLER